MSSPHGRLWATGVCLRFKPNVGTVQHDAVLFSCLGYFYGWAGGGGAIGRSDWNKPIPSNLFLQPICESSFDEEGRFVRSSSGMLLRSIYCVCTCTFSFVQASRAAHAFFFYATFLCFIYVYAEELAIGGLGQLLWSPCWGLRQTEPPRAMTCAVTACVCTFIRL